MARSRGFEPLTAWFVARYSIQLSYERVKGVNTNNFLINCNPKSVFIPFLFRKFTNARSFTSVYCWYCDAVLGLF